MDNENKTTINRSYQANVEYERLKAAKTGIAKGILRVFNSNSIKYAPILRPVILLIFVPPLYFVVVFLLQLYLLLVSYIRMIIKQIFSLVNQYFYIQN